MKKLLLLFYFAFALGPVCAQTGFPDDVKELVYKIKTDTLFGIIPGLTSSYVANHPDSGIYYAKELIAYSKQNNDRHILASGLNIYSYALYNQGNYPAALNLAFQSLKIIENSTYPRVLAGIYNLIGNIYKGQQNYPKALYYYRRSKQSALVSHNEIILSASYFNMAFVFKETNVLDSALYYSGLAVKKNTDATRQFMGYILSTFGDEYLKLKNYKKALEYYLAAYKLDQKNADFRDASITSISLSKYYTLTGKSDSAVYYAQQALYSAKRASYNKSVFESAALLARLYEARHQPDSGFKYLKLSSIAKDSLYSAAKSGEMENLTTDEFLRQNEIQAAQKAYQNKLKLYALIFGLLVLFIAALLQWRNSRQRKKAYSLLQQQKEEIEEQKAQAMIEAALERVRTKTMAMHNSQDVADTVAAMFDELVKLGIGKDVRSGIGIIDDTAHIELWTAFTKPDGQASLIMGSLDLTIHPMVQSLYNAWKDKEEYFFYEMTGDDLIAYYQALNDAPGYPTRFDLASLPAGQFQYDFFFPEGTIFAFSPNPLTPEALQIFKRFAGVFGLTYRRYLDLQKAEAQARESQIQLGLERVRARAMAMQSSGELADVVDIVFKELTRLDFGLTHCAIAIADAGSDGLTLWQANAEADQPPVSFYRKSFDHPYPNAAYNEWKKRTPKWVYHLKGAEKKAMHDYYASSLETMYIPDAVKEGMAAFDSITLSHSFSNFGYLRTDTTHPLSEDNLDIVYRFAKVFDLCYTRFTDIKQAEAQAKESQIQLGLERVRAKAMAMQTSEELNELIGTVFGELTKLDFVLARCLIMIFDPETNSSRWWMANSEVPAEPMNYLVQNHKNPAYDAYLKAWKERNLKWRYALKGKVKRDWDDFLFVDTELAQLPAPVIEGMKAPEQVLLSASFNNFGSLTLVTLEPLSDEQSEIMLRFAKVFDMSYTRFNDLKQAEAQAREARIEAALERVRSKTMAMHSSSDVADTAAVMFDELVKLGVERAVRCGIGILTRGSSEIEVWTAKAGENEKPELIIGHFDTNIHPLSKGLYDAWHKHEQSFSYVLAGDDRVKYYESINSQPGYPIKFDISKLPSPQYHNDFFFAEGVLYAFTSQPLNDEISSVFKRFAGVFGQTYRRYLDLQKAEAQAREANIEAALERVRSRTMAMQKSDELKQAIQLIYEQLIQLNFSIDVANFALDHTESNDFNLWLAVAGQQYPAKIYIPYFDHPVFRQFVEAKEKGIDFYAFECTLEEKNEFFNHFFKYAPQVSKEKEEAVYSSRGYAQSTVLMKTISLAIINYAGLPYSEAENIVLRRFGKVFEQTYTRFLDLQQAEAQAREARIEAGLERVRAKAMSMHTSEELNELIGTVFGELTKLDVVLTRCKIMIFDPETKASRWWMANPEAPSEPMNYLVQNHEHETYESYIKAWDTRVLKWQYELKSKIKKTWDDFLFVDTELSLLPPAVITGMKTPEQVILSASFNNFGCLTLVSLEPLSDEHFDLLLRFAKVFDMSYTRFNDLKQAEAQAREARIEAALEKVRGKAMAMYNSKDLSSAASMVFTELRKLGLNSKRCGVALLSKNSRTAQSYVATSSGDNDSFDLLGTIELAGHPSLEKQYRSWLKNENYFDVLKGDDLKSYKEVIYKEVVYSMLPVPDDQSDQEEYGYFLPFSEGFLFSWTANPFSEKEINILTRFKNIIDLTFRRYLELQKSEASARAAVREASLDRVRAEIASMRKRNDLERITPLIWEELTVLGIPFIRCGVFIMDEKQKLIHTFLSTPDGKAIGAFHVPFDTSGNFEKMVDSWRHGVPYIDHWEEEAFSQFADTLVKQGAIASKAQYMRTLPREGINLNFLPFLQGMLYVGNTTPLSNDEIELVQSLADAFSTAYARYEDFNKLEAAKKVVEETLTDLKAAQTQLIQSEKMASLGELTAGIAHEIQNPLNFVNNFSEVNSELIEEMEDEIGKGNFSEVKAIAADLKQNEQKINMHGKRADSIVKSMLEHSRISSGEKQMTDMNVLADEFIKLSYHGLRAKDKSFNAEMTALLDPELPKINVVQQDIGRVLLNLFNNAFYAVNQKKKALNGEYKPEVTVTTLTENGHVTIKVKDNGIGIPEHIKDKIMQPFFTTKPTGEGTGLGLSLSYDIVVKGHGGTIQINSVEGERSEFIIQLPLN